MYGVFNLSKRVILSETTTHAVWCYQPSEYLRLDGIKKAGWAKGRKDVTGTRPLRHHLAFPHDSVETVALVVFQATAKDACAHQRGQLFGTLTGGMLRQLTGRARLEVGKE